MSKTQPADRIQPNTQFTHHRILDPLWGRGPDGQPGDGPVGGASMVITEVTPTAVFYSFAGDTRHGAYRASRAVFEAEYGAEL